MSRMDIKDVQVGIRGVDSLQARQGAAACVYAICRWGKEPIGEMER